MAENRSEKVIDPTEPKIVEFISNACRNTSNEINFLEHVEVITTVQYSFRGGLQVDLTFPQGTRTRLLFLRKRDKSATGFNAWPFVSVHTWGENPFGKWMVNITDASKDRENRGEVDEVELVLYGTKEAPKHLESGRRIYPQEYKKKSIVPLPDSKETPSAKLRAILNDLEMWMN